MYWRARQTLFLFQSVVKSAQTHNAQEMEVSNTPFRNGRGFQFLPCHGLAVWPEEIFALSGSLE